MRVEIVAVGTELLLGQITNSNARWMSEHLAAVGADVLYHQSVGDNLDRIVDALGLAGSRADVVIVTGGLGPTQDDITRDALAQVLDVGMIRNDAIVELLREKFRRFARDEMPASNLRQADVPEGARTILPDRGTAPGLVAKIPGGATVYALPGVPAEMVEMMEGTVLPELAGRAGATIVSRVLRCTGIGESRVAELVDDLFRATSNPSVAFLATNGEVKIRVTAKASNQGDADALIAPVAEQVRERLGDAVFTSEDEELEEVVVRLLRATGTTLACAESLTGGGLAARLTRVPGASQVVAGSAVVYTSKAKGSVLHVPDDLLARRGAVSEETALAMAAGARDLYGTDVAVALTGAAGPDPHDGAPPGTVWVALETAGLRHARGFSTPGGRARVRRWAEQAALDLVRRHLEGRTLPVSDRIV